MRALWRRYGQALRPTDPSKYQTRSVLAGAYKGGRKRYDAMLTHSSHDEEFEDAICGRVQPGGLCDVPLGGPPTCKRCFKLDPRFKGQEPPEIEAAAKDVRAKSAKPGDTIVFTSLLGSQRFEGVVKEKRSDGYHVTGAGRDWAAFNRVVSINGQEVTDR